MSDRSRTEGSTTPEMRSSPPGARNEQTDAAKAEPEELEDDESDPQEPMDEFDWQDLQERYHKMIEQQSGAEKEVYDDFEKLMNVRLARS